MSLTCTKFTFLGLYRIGRSSEFFLILRPLYKGRTQNFTSPRAYNIRQGESSDQPISRGTACIYLKGELGISVSHKTWDIFPNMTSTEKYWDIFLNVTSSGKNRRCFSNKTFTGRGRLILENFWIQRVGFGAQKDMGHVKNKVNRPYSRGTLEKQMISEKKVFWIGNPVIRRRADKN